MLERIGLRIKRQETFLYKTLYKTASSVIRFSVPSIKPVHLPLYYLHRGVVAFILWAKHGLWDVPLFKARCEVCGEGLVLPNGIPLVMGNLELQLGRNVTIMRSTFGTGTVFDKGVLRIGNNTRIGYGTAMSISREIDIGENVLMGANCILMDGDDHPIQPDARRHRAPVEKRGVAPVRIGNNVWLGARVTVLKGVTIGDNSIIGTASVVTKNIPPNCIAVGFPVRIVKSDIDRWQSKD